MVTKSLMVVPPGFRVGTAVIDGEATSVFVKKVSRKGSKVSKKTRERISKRLREVRVPVLTIVANSVPIIEGGAAAFNLLKNPQNHDLQRNLVNSVSGAYTGVVFNPGWVPLFRPELTMKALIPNIVVWGVNKIGIFRSANQKLARTRLPVRLN